MAKRQDCEQCQQGTCPHNHPAGPPQKGRLLLMQCACGNKVRLTRKVIDSIGHLFHETESDVCEFVEQKPVEGEDPTGA